MARFLVIDDDSTIRHLIAYALETAGHDVAQAGSGREGTMLFKSKPADVVITDLIMPSDSLETVIELRNEYPALPFILVSGLAKDSPQTVDVALALQARRTLAKPFNLAELLVVVTEVLEEEKLHPPAPD